MQIGVLIFKLNTYPFNKIFSASLLYFLYFWVFSYLSQQITYFGHPIPIQGRGDVFKWYLKPKTVDSIETTDPLSRFSKLCNFTISIIWRHFLK